MVFLFFAPTMKLKDHKFKDGKEKSHVTLKVLKAQKKNKPPDTTGMKAEWMTTMIETPFSHLFLLTWKTCIQPPHINRFESKHRISKNTMGLTGTRFNVILIIDLKLLDFFFINIL